jgi:aerobic carbon-monoxide dehydrogenase small subunit
MMAVGRNPSRQRRSRGTRGRSPSLDIIERRAIALSVNGRKHLLTFGDDIQPWEPGAYDVYPWHTLLYTLRERLHLTGTKPSCNRGACGACTVILDGLAVLACTTLTVDCHNKSVITIEGLGTPDTLHPIQQAFIENNAAQCGFCTPGMVMATKAMLDKNLNPTVDDIRTELANNTCRCGNYSFITRAVLAAAKALREK